MKIMHNPVLLALAVIAGFLAQAMPADNQPEERQQCASQWDHATAQRLFRKGAWREGVAYLGRALRLDPQNSAAARHLWSAVVDGVGDRNTLPALVLRQEAEIHTAVFSPDGRRILTAGADKTARLWDATTGVQVGAAMRHEDEVMDAAFSPDGARIATASKDRTKRLWDAATGRPVGTPMRHESPLGDLAFNSTGTRIVTQCSEGGVVQLWDAATGAPVGEALPHKAADGKPATFSPDYSRLVTVSGETARVLDSATGKPLGKPLRHSSALSSVALSPDGSRLLTVTEDGKRHGKAQAQVWSIAAGKVLFTLSIGKLDEFESAYFSAEFSPDGTRIVTLVGRTGQLWDAATGRRVGGLLACAHSDAEGGTRPIFSPDSTCLLLSASEDKMVRAWNCETGQRSGFPSRDAPTFLRHPEEVSKVFFTADGMRIVTSCHDHAVRVWDAESGTLVGQPMRHEHRDDGGELESVAASPDGTRILTVDAKNTVRVWNVDAGQPAAESDDGEQMFTDRESGEHEREVPPRLTGTGLPAAFVEVLSGYRFSDEGVLGEIPDIECAALRTQLRASESIDPAWHPLIRWWLAPPNERALSPGTMLTRRDRADREIATGANDHAAIHRAYLMDPTHPLIHIALAGLELEHEKRADFLRAYGIARLPADPAIRARAAEMLIKQEQPELARKATVTPTK